MPRNSDLWRQRLVIIACALSVFIVSTDTNTVNVALPSLQAAFEVPLTSLQFLISAYTMGLASFYLLSGTVGDRFGRRNVLLAGLVLFAVGSVLCATAWSFPVLVTFRIVQALGAAMLAPMAMAILNDEFTDRATRARAIGIWAMAGGVGSGFGPIAGGLLVSAFGWRGIYWATAPFAIAALVIGIVAIRNVTSSTRPALNLGAQALLAIGLCSILVLSVELGSNGLSGLAIGAFAALVASAGAFAWLELRSRDPLVEPSLFRRGRFTGAITAIMAGFFLLGGAFFLTSFFIQQELGLDPLGAGLLMTAWAIGSILAATFLGRSGARRPVGFYYVLFGIVAVVGLAALVAAAIIDAPIWALLVTVVGLFAVGAAFALANTATSIFGLEAVSSDIMGRAAAFLSVGRQVAQAMGVALTSVVFHATAANAGSGYPSSYLFVGIVVLALLALVPFASGARRPCARPRRELPPV